MVASTFGSEVDEAVGCGAQLRAGPGAAPPEVVKAAGFEPSTEQVLAAVLEITRSVGSRSHLGAALTLAAGHLTHPLGADLGVALRVLDWQSDGLLVQAWSAAGQDQADHIDPDSLTLVQLDDLPLGRALATQRPVHGPADGAVPRAWRPTDAGRILVVPVRLGQRAVAALELHHVGLCDERVLQMLELVGLQLSLCAQREEAMRASWVQAEQFGRVTMLAMRTGRGAVITDADGIVEWTHPLFAETTGHGHADMRGRPLWEVLLRDADDVRPAVMLRERFRAGGAFRVEFMARRGAVCLAPNEAYWLEVDAEVVVDDATGRLQYVCICRDISHRKERQMGMDEAREILAALTDNLPISLVALDARDLQVMSLNRQAEVEFGAVVEPSGAHPMPHALGPGLAQLISTQARLAARRAEPVEHEFCWAAPTGTRIVAARHVGVGRRDGRARIVISQLRDVTEIRRQEQVLRESEQRYRELVESIDEGVFVADPVSGTYEYLSPRAHEMLGLAGMPSSSAMSSVLPEDRPAIDTQMARENGGSASDITVRIQHPQRGLRWLRRRARVRPLADGGLRVYGLFDDVTEERERALQLHAAHDAAQAASRAKSRFLATMSHEIRTPMNGILGMTELLLGTSLSARQQRFARAVYRSGAMLLETLNDVLDFAKIEAGHMVLTPTGFSLRALFEDAVELFSAQAELKGLVIRLSEDEGVPDRVQADPVRLRQVLTNLLGNAVKFTDVGEVGIRLSRVDGPADDGRMLLECRVRDTGIGIAAQDQTRLFSAFTQVHRGRARRYGGTGLGLAISSQLVALMGGEIGVTSAPGEGAEFRFTFAVMPNGGELHDPPEFRSDEQPGTGAAGRAALLAFDPAQAPRSGGRAGVFAACADTPETVQGPSTGDAGQRARPVPLRHDDRVEAEPDPDGARVARDASFRLDAQVLVVEDNVVNQEVMRQMLLGWGACVEVCGSAADGLRALQRKAFDLVLMDIEMPGMDGVEALRQLRRGCEDCGASETRAEVPVIAVTANAQRPDDPKWLDLGFDGCLPKPYRRGQLLRLLDRLVPHCRTRLGSDIERGLQSTPSPSHPGRADPGGRRFGDEFPLLDPAALARLQQLDPTGQNDLVRRVMVAFDATVARFAGELPQARRCSDEAGVQHVVHTLKSSAASVGAHELATLSAQCERQLRQGVALSALVEPLDRLEAELHRMRTSLLGASGAATGGEADQGR